MAGVITLLDQPRTLDALGRATDAFIFFYYTGTTTLAPIFTDAALTTPAANPVDLAAGEIFPDIYLNPAITYRRRILYGDGTIHDVDPLPADGVGPASSITFTPPGTGGVTRSVQDKLLETAVSITDYGADPTGVQTNTAIAITRALSHSKTIFIPEGTYNFGNTTGGAFVDLAPYGEGVRFVTEGDVTFFCNTTTNVISFFFQLDGNSRFSCGRIKFRDDGYDPGVTWKGAAAFALVGGNSQWGDLQFDGIHSRRMVASVLSFNGHATNRIRGINIDQLISDDCYYGFNLQDNGDGVTIGNLIATQNYRPYFVYGVSDHKVKIFSRNNRLTSGAVNIARFPSGYPTKSIEVDYTSRDNAVDITHVLIDHLDLVGGTISDIRVHVDIESASLYYPVRFVNYNSGSESASASPNIVRDIFISGICDGQGRDIETVASYGSKGIVRIDRSSNLNPSATTLTKFFGNYTIRTAALTWTATGTAPAIGNGALNYSADIIDGMCYATISLTWGSTTTGGTGVWFFTLPHIATVSTTGMAWSLDSGTNNPIGLCQMPAGAGQIQCYSASAGNPYGPTHPFTWANGDRLVITIAFPIT